ncbi:MAG: 4-hydroxy-tetrahydrodipicolinate reductase [Deltaproteobacteria bacterium]|nr:4-hydroxy-tetrahydrodipicolinate reductase [Deltaproteobacteria bacterium]
MIAVAVVGALGRMGREVVRLVEQADDLALVGAFDRLAASEAARTPLARDLGATLAHARVVIDFSSPEGTRDLVTRAAALGVAVVSGTTGLGPDERAALEAASRIVPVVHAPNMSVGVHVLLGLVAEAARKLGPEFDIEVVEMHHRHKVDAPSGTALRIAESIQGVRPGLRAVHGRSGAAGPRGGDEIGILALRGGDVVGDHQVLFAGPGERVEIAHRASSRETFARGALRAARWVHGRPAGLFGMADVLAG